MSAQQMEGSVSRRIRPIKEQLVELIALLEAGIDFAEDDISVASPEEILRRLAPIQQGVERLVASGRITIESAVVTARSREGKKTV